MSLRWFALALPLLASVAAASEPAFKKAYFGETKPGTFAKLKSTDQKGAVSEYTYSRLADQAGERWFELRYAMLTGKFKGTSSVTACLIPASFPVETDAIDFQKYARRCAWSAGGAPASEYPPETMKAIAAGVLDYSSMVQFKGNETIDGRACDRYAYSYKSNYSNQPATLIGDLWLDESVPFGVVKEIGAWKGASGKVLATFENVLVEAGSNARSAIGKWSWGAAHRRR